MGSLEYIFTAACLTLTTKFKGDVSEASLSTQHRRKGAETIVNVLKRC